MSDMGFARARVTSGSHEMNIKVLNTISRYSCTYTDVRSELSSPIVVCQEKGYE
jgi:hypothetical protein